MFDDRTTALGIFRSPLGLKPIKPYPWLAESVSVNVFDWNGDDRDDIWFGDHTQVPAHAQLFVNVGDHFVEADIVALGLDQKGDPHGGVWADFDSDGCPDLLRVSGGQGVAYQDNTLLIREPGDGRFVDHAVALGIADGPARTRGVEVADLDRDGDLDVVTAAYCGTEESTIHVFLYDDSDHFVLQAEPNVPWAARAPAIHDVDRDGNIELFFSHCNFPAAAPELTFDVATGGFQRSDFFPVQTPLMSRPPLFADFNGDGYADVYVPTRSFLPVEVAQIAADALLIGLDQYLPDAGNSIEVSITPEIATTAITLNLLRNNDYAQASLFGADQILLGATGWHPASTSFMLDPADPRLAGLANRPLDTTEPLMLLGWDEAAAAWTLRFDRLPIRTFDQLLIEAVEGELGATPVAGVDPGALCTPDVLFFFDPATNRFVEDVEQSQRLTYNSVGAAAADFDNDGDTDVYVAQATGLADLPDVVLLNDGTGRFVPQMVAATVTPYRTLAYDGLEAGPLPAIVDADGDGLQDVVLRPTGIPLGAPDVPATPPRLLINTEANDNHWLDLVLEGVVSNRDAIGAVATVTVGERAQTLVDNNGQLGGFAQSRDVLHFGLGASVVADRLEIVWPSGVVQVLDDVAGDRLLRVREPSDTGAVVTVAFVAENAGFNNLLGWYDPVAGTAAVVIADSEQGSGLVETIVVEEHDRAEFFLVPDGGDGFAAGGTFAGEDPAGIDWRVVEREDGRWLVYAEDGRTLEGRRNGAAPLEPLAYFSETKKNPDGVAHAVAVADGRIGFEDIWGGGDGDFDDLVLTVDGFADLLLA